MRLEMQVEESKCDAASADSGVVNISAYLFAPLSDLKALRAQLLERCAEWELKGTILLSTEGVNLFVAGAGDAIDLLVGLLRSVPGLEALTPKRSLSANQPFNRMLVRIKKEIIAFGVEGIDPGRRTSPKLPPAELKRWLDEGRPVTLLDTRNDYEVKLGTFKGALPIGVDTFRQFPDAVAKLPDTLKSEPIVMFCTGGIRCEKAGPYMENVGFENIYQLDGGILKYFEECGGDHYDGECFVFDERVGVDPALRETDTSKCFACQAPLDPTHRADPRYVAGESCPFCFESNADRLAREFGERCARLKHSVNPLPGSTPYENLRPLRIPAAFDRFRLIDFLNSAFPHRPDGEWERICAKGGFQNEAAGAVTADQIIRAGQRYFRRLPGMVEPDVNPDIQLLYDDDTIIVVDKPAPLPVHPGGRFNRNTLQHILGLVYAPHRPRPGHRLDANTSGVMVFSRVHRFASVLQSQFSEGTVKKAYLAVIDGHPPDDAFDCDLPITDSPGPLGSRTIGTGPDALSACTNFRVKERRADGTALVEAIPITGRTNQIRIHLWALGWPIVGDPVYLRDGGIGTSSTLPVSAPPMRLHAWLLGFRHPRTEKFVEFESPMPRNWEA